MSCEADPAWDGRFPGSVPTVSPNRPVLVTAPRLHRAGSSPPARAATRPVSPASHARLAAALALIPRSRSRPATTPTRLPAPAMEGCGPPSTSSTRWSRRERYASRPGHVQLLRPRRQRHGLERIVYLRLASGQPLRAPRLPAESRILASANAGRHFCARHASDHRLGSLLRIPPDPWTPAVMSPPLVATESAADRGAQRRQYLVACLAGRPVATLDIGRPAPPYRALIDHGQRSPPVRRYYPPAAHPRSSL